MKNVWAKPDFVEVKMDAEISSYQEDTRDPLRDGPLFVEEKADIER